MTVQQRPDQATLLDAVAQFLVSEVYPAIPDKKLNFRVLIAANLANIVSAELKTLDEREVAELSRLKAMLPGLLEDEPSKLPAPARAAALATLNRELASRLRRRRLSRMELAGAQAHIKQTLIETLAVVNPRFDTSPTIE